MSNSHPQHHADELLSQLLDESPSAATRDALQHTLRHDPAARRRLVDHLLLDVMLHEQLAPESVSGMVDLLGGAPLARRSVDGHSELPPTSSGLTATFSPEASETDLLRSNRWQRSSLMKRLLAAAAILVMTLTGVLLIIPQDVSAATMLADARRVHALPLDRCYVVELRSTDLGDSSTASPRRSGPIELAVGRVDRLWTRGDQFFLESSNAKHRWVWGRDADGAVWLCVDARLGLKLEDDELPQWLDGLSDALSMQLDTLLDNVLRDFTLTWEPAAGGTTRTVRAVRKPDARPRWITEVRLTVDLETRVLQRITVIRPTRIRGPVEVTYTLAATEAQPDSRYSLEGHLDASSTILTRTQSPERRAEILTRLFGDKP